MLFNFTDGADVHRSLIGSVLSMGVMTFTMLYLLNNLIVMARRMGTSYTASSIPDFKEESFKVTHADGLALAVAVIDYRTDDGSDPNGRPLSDFFEVEVVTAYENGPDTYEETQSPTHPCTEEELGLKNPSDSKFYKASDSALKELQGFWTQFLCLDLDNIYLKGTENSIEISHLQIRLKIPKN